MRRLIFVLLAGALALSGAPPVGAHRQVVESPENPGAKRVDIESVEVIHPPDPQEEFLWERRPGHVRFTITFRNDHPLAEEGAFLRINLRTQRRSAAPPPPQRYVTLRRNPDGSLVGDMRNRGGSIRSHTNFYIPDARTVVIEFHRQQLRFPRRARFIDWNLVADYREDECVTGDVVGICTESVSRNGRFFLHRL